MSSTTEGFAPDVDATRKYYGPPAHGARPTFGAATHVGFVRKNNEDHYAVVQRYRSRRVLLTNVPREQVLPTQEEAYALAVADGLGGEAYGELASRLALTSLWHWGGRESRWLMNVGDLDREALEEQIQALGDLLSNALQVRARCQPETRGMATTLTIAYTVGRHVFVLHIGDSRAYLIRSGAIERLTTDHTLAEELLASGMPEDQVARSHHILTNCLASNGSPVGVEWRRQTLERGDWLLLCTDGLTDLVDDQEIASVIQHAANPQAACDQLVQLALDRGGKDNVTVVAGQYDFE